MCLDEESYEIDKRPLTPSSEDCCGNGCNPCILDVHTKLLEEWEKRKEKNIPLEKNRNLLNNLTYSSFLIIDKSETSKDCILLWLKYKGNTDKKRIIINPGQHVILKVDNVSRSFTPISWKTDCLLFLIKLYSNGKFSNIVKNSKIGNEINIRGPYGDFIYRLNSYREIYMFCIGSGITAVFPVAQDILKNELEETKIKLLAGFESFSHIPLKKELRKLSDYWNFNCTLYISCKHNSNLDLHGIEIINSRINEEVIHNALKCNKPDETLILICGTTKFNNFIKNNVTEINQRNIHIFE